MSFMFMVFHYPTPEHRDELLHGMAEMAGFFADKPGLPGSAIRRQHPPDRGSRPLVRKSLRLLSPTSHPSIYGVVSQFQVWSPLANKLPPVVHWLVSHTSPVAAVRLAAGSGVAPP